MDRYDHFLKSGAAEEAVFTGFIRTLQMILVDPLRLAPLDEECFSGKDGRVYGKKTVLLYLNDIPKEQRHTVHFLPLQPHILARFMVQWLKKRDALLRVPEIEEEFTIRSKDPQFSMQIPNPECMRAFERIALLKHKQQQKTSSVDNLIEKVSAQIKTTIQELNQEEQELRQQQQELIRRAREQDQIQLQEIQVASDHLRNECSTLHAECQVLERDLQSHKKRIDQVELVHTELEYGLKELEAAIKERNSNWMKQLLPALITIAVCVTVSAVAPGGLSLTAGEGAFKIGIAAAI